jgi:hypothetical protein
MESSEIGYTLGLISLDIPFDMDQDRAAEEFIGFLSQGKRMREGKCIL